jgi:hypothetical protein
VAGAHGDVGRNTHDDGAVFSQVDHLEWSRDFAEALELVEASRRICEWSRAPWMIENPVSTLGSYWRKPDHTFHPHEFGGWEGGEEDDYRKRTCLWTGGGFRFPQKREIPAFRPLFIHNMPPSDNRGSLRSVTPPGFARAVFEANVGRHSGNAG